MCEYDHGDPSLPYAAGLFDGEGTVAIRLSSGGRYTAKERKKYHEIQVSISSTDEIVILWLFEHWQGNISIHRYANTKHRELYRWSCTGPTAEKFLRDIRPFTLIKSARIDLALKLRSTTIARGELLTDELKEHREQMRQEMLRLNKRGA